MPSKHRIQIKRNRRRQRALFHKAEDRKQIQESAKVILADVDRLIDRLALALDSLQKTRATVLIQTLALANIKTKI